MEAFSISYFAQCPHLYSDSTQIKLSMKINSNNNPQASLDQSLNFPSIGSFTNHEQYEHQKKQRRELQMKRKMLEDTVATLRREAGEGSKKFHQTQDELMSTYNKKLTTLEQVKQKNEQKRLQHEQLEKRKNYSSLSRYLHQVKKEQAMQNLLSKKKQMINKMKNYLEEAESKREKNQKEYLIFLNQKNKRMSELNKSNTKWAKDRSLEQKRKESRIVRNELITIQQSLMARQRERIEKLQNQQKSILNLLEKNSHKCNQVESMRSQLLAMDLEDFQSRVIQNMQDSKISIQTRKITRSKKKRARSRDLNLFYY